MKKLLPFTLAILCVVLAFSPVGKEENAPVMTIDQNQFEYPDNVMAILDNKCMGCHNPDSRNEKAKSKLQWSALQGMSKSDLVAALDEVLEELEEGSMPPAKMLEKYPDKELTKKETKTLMKWADNLADDLMGE